MRWHAAIDLLSFGWDNNWVPIQKKKSRVREHVAYSNYWSTLVRAGSAGPPEVAPSPHEVIHPYAPSPIAPSYAFVKPTHVPSMVSSGADGRKEIVLASGSMRRVERQPTHLEAVTAATAKKAYEAFASELVAYAEFLKTATGPNCARGTHTVTEMQQPLGALAFLHASMRAAQSISAMAESGAVYLAAIEGYRAILACVIGHVNPAAIAKPIKRLYRASVDKVKSSCRVWFSTMTDAEKVLASAARSGCAEKFAAAGAELRDFFSSVTEDYASVVDCMAEVEQVMGPEA